MNQKTSTHQSAEKRSLSQDRILQTAITIADEGGLNALTIRKLADRLETKPMSIYHYVANKDAIVDGMIDLVFKSINLPAEHADWYEAIRLRSSSARTVLAQHPWAISLMDSRRSPGPGTLRHHEAVIRCFRQNGFSIALTAHACALIDAYIYGFVIQEASLPATQGEAMEELVSEVTESFGDDHYPFISELANHHVLSEDYDFKNEFDTGLEIILDSLKRRQALESSNKTKNGSDHES